MIFVVQISLPNFPFFVKFRFLFTLFKTNQIQIKFSLKKVKIERTLTLHLKFVLARFEQHLILHDFPSTYRTQLHLQ